MSNETEYIGVCTECKSDQPASYMEKSPFSQPPCKYCGGVVEIIMYTSEENRRRFLDNRDVERGLYHEPGD